MENLMKFLQYILLALVMFVHPVMPSIVLLGLSLISFQKHDWQEGFFDDNWGTLGSVTFLLAIVTYVVMVYLPSQA
jgi:hypothetical protein